MSASKKRRARRKPPGQAKPESADHAPPEKPDEKPKKAKKAEPPKPWDERLVATIFGPQPIIRLAFLRIGIPIAILCFMSSRIANSADWLSTDGFHPPDLGGDWRQPISIPPISPMAASILCTVLVMSGISVAVGFLTRWSAAVFAALLAYVALADRLAAFTVSKLAPILILALCLTPAGARYSIDAWRARRREPAMPQPTHVTGGSIRFFQFLLPVFYVSSGICKAKGEWLEEPYILWSHLHDSYQTGFSWFVANHAPTWSWPIMQGTTLAFECGAPLLFALSFTRPYALAYGIAMHTMIGLMFGPVIWFSLLMIVMLFGSYAPQRWLERALRRFA